MKRSLSVVCLSATLAISAVRVRAQDRAEDVTATVVSLATREAKAFVKAFNHHKPQEISALFTPDADLAFLQGASIEKLDSRLIRGRDTIVSNFDTFFAEFPNARITENVIYARMIRPDLLVADVDFEITGLGNDEGPIQGRAVVFRVLESGQWKITSERSFSKVSAAK
jgi:uncharacterized protein (TIGR02246 family)